MAVRGDGASKTNEREDFEIKHGIFSAHAQL